MGHAWRLCRRHPAVAALLVTLAMTLATGVVGLFVLLNRVTAERARLAEARRHADGYQQFSASAADQLGVFLRTTIRYQGKTTPDQMTTALLKLRSSTNDLKSRRNSCSAAHNAVGLSPASPTALWAAEPAPTPRSPCRRT